MGEIDELSMFAFLKDLIDFFSLKRMMPYADMLIRNCINFKKNDNFVDEANM